METDNSIKRKSILQRRSFTESVKRSYPEVIDQISYTNRELEQCMEKVFRLEGKACQARMIDRIKSLQNELTRYYEELNLKIDLKFPPDQRFIRSE